MRVGILALQGAFAAHERPLRELGHDTVLVRAPQDFAGLEGLVLPGGESSVHLMLLERFSLEEPIIALHREGRPILATCAGLILLAKRVASPEQRSLGLLDVDVERNAYGRQLESFEASADVLSDGRAASGASADMPLVFIRAPRITRVGPGVEVMATCRGEPVLVRQGSVVGAAFHPELTRDVRVHRAAFGELCEPRVASNGAVMHGQPGS